MADKKEYRIKVQGQLISVTEEVYLTYYRMKRRELHLEEKDAAHALQRRQRSKRFSDFIPRGWPTARLPCGYAD